MTNNIHIPEFAVLGHPNEGKSSVVSTLTEDDSVRISPYPGETTRCRVFPVSIDGNEIIRFTDTPGFQVPQKTLSWFKEFKGTPNRIIREFIEENKNNDLYRDECELFSPVANGAGIIYVADGSRPVRRNDLAEMEILKLTGMNRLAIINSKSNETDYSDQWKEAFGQHFNAVIKFNAHNATYRERLMLLECLKRIDSNWQQALEKVISAFKNDWEMRNALTSEMICSMLENCLCHKISGKCTDRSQRRSEKKKLLLTWNSDIQAMEKNIHKDMRKLFKHNIFNIELPAGSILSKDLFDSETWQVLGLTRTQLAAAAATVGGAAAAVIDLALAGHSLGLFTLLGGAAGAGSALIGADSMGKVKVIGKPLGRYKLKVGPIKNIQFMYILIDRALIYYSHIINWAHGKRNTPAPDHLLSSGDKDLSGYTSRWKKDTKNIFNSFFHAIQSNDPEKKENAKKKAMDHLKACLDKIPYEQ